MPMSGRAQTDEVIADLLILLEAGPASLQDLCTWLTRSKADMTRRLGRLLDDGAVVYLADETAWALAPAVDPGDHPPEVDLGLDVEADLENDGDDADREAAVAYLLAPRQGRGRRPGLRQTEKAVDVTGPAWWVGLDRDALRREAEARAVAMSQSRLARTVDASVRI